MYAGFELDDSTYRTVSATSNADFVEKKKQKSEALSQTNKQTCGYGCSGANAYSEEMTIESVAIANSSAYFETNLAKKKKNSKPFKKETAPDKHSYISSACPKKYAPPCANTIAPRGFPVAVDTFLGSNKRNAAKWVSASSTANARSKTSTSSNEPGRWRGMKNSKNSRSYEYGAPLSQSMF